MYGPKVDGKWWGSGAEVETLSGYVYPAKLPIGLGMGVAEETEGMSALPILIRREGKGSCLVA